MPPPLSFTQIHTLRYIMHINIVKYCLFLPKFMINALSFPHNSNYSRRAQQDFRSIASKSCLRCSIACRKYTHTHVCLLRSARLSMHILLMFRFIPLRNVLVDLRSHNYYVLLGIFQWAAAAVVVVIVVVQK